ncbi:alpha-ketoglutarate decarboxylase [Constantimarinum furrinae]|uniref:Alpha-ketoglutarate decarboxylase n=1 Tax=Constantimarinum furrinae TaxID=2562285 RepID=A0A7G8PTR7_9FLAO|nr:alpha-ketoglutarate decarboxylase [Constantimarinum furrinae]QNJ97733.1 hypothetical protein ALE3EI_1163 [Constantimarinum furrinae]
MNLAQRRCSVKLIFSLCLLLISLNTFAQEKRSPFWSQVRFGGGIGLSFGDGFFSGTLAPSAIYEFNSQFALGVGLNGTYSSLKDRYNATILGGSVLGLYNVIPEIQLSAEFEELHVSRNFEESLGIEDDTYWYPALFLGVGYRTQHVTIGIRYDVLYEEEDSIYANAWMPFVRVYF